MIKQTLFVPLLATAIGGPFLLLSGSEDSDGNSEKTAEEQVEALTPDLKTNDKPVYQPVSKLSDVFGFHLTAAEISNRTGRATTADLDGYQTIRTSVLTGHAAQDISGGITYQFNFRKRLARIQFTGFVEDPSSLIEFLKNEFGFRPTSGNGTEFATSGISSYSGKVTIVDSSRYEKQKRIDLEIKR